MNAPDIGAVRAAAKRIAPYVHRTAVISSQSFDQEIGATVLFKCENQQKVGAFKARGAVNAVMSLSDADANRGVITHSSGNHGAALAYAANIRGIACTVVMPDDTPTIKADAVHAYGADVVFCRRAERQTVCDTLQRELGSTLVHPFENPHVIAGQGTVALELLEEIDALDLVIAPVGGGGLLAGTTVTVRALAPSARVVGAEPKAVDDAQRSLQTGILQPTVKGAKTVGDGLMTGLGAINFAMLQHGNVSVTTVSESAIVDATRFVLQRMKVVVEPSAATVVAALRELGPTIRGLRIGAIFSGGNTDFRWLCPEASDS
ncbi:MAG: pyridoxal-phosphate dependent enzyme [Pseudomonadota bacterium]